MICSACNKVSYSSDNEDCFEKALDMLKKHYTYYKNGLQQRELELQQVIQRNDLLNKALQLLQKNQHAAKRFKSHHSEESLLGSNSTQEDQVASEPSPTDDESISASNLNVALNSEQLFDTSALSQTISNVTATSSEMVQSPRIKEYCKRNKQHDEIHKLKDGNKEILRRTKSEWHKKERNNSCDSSWAMKFLQPTKSEERTGEELKKTVDKRLCLSLKKNNSSKMKQTHIKFNKQKETTFLESAIAEDVVEASPAVVTKTSKSGRSWSHRSAQSCDITVKEPIKTDITNKLLENIVFDFSPSKKTDSSQNEKSLKSMEPKRLNFESDISSDCTSAPSNNLEISTNKSESSSVLILTPTSQDIIFLDDTCDIEPEIDTMDLLGDIMKENCTNNWEKLKKYESKCFPKQQISTDIGIFKKPSNKKQTTDNGKTLITIKQEKTSQHNLLQQEQFKEVIEERPVCSKSTTHKTPPLFLSSKQEDTEDDEDFMPKPFLIKEENQCSKTVNELSIKKRFNIDCEDCEKLINFLDNRLTDDQIQKHLDKCKRHNNPGVMRQNTPPDFWNPFILSFQTDDPRNEVLIDERFKDNKN